MFRKVHPHLKLSAATVLLIFLAMAYSDVMPDFSSYPDMPSRKEAFINYLLPKIDTANSRIREKRNHLLYIYSRYKDGVGVSRYQKIWVKRLAAEYGVSDPDFSSTEFWNSMINKVDTVPLSLALTQAAVESAWGTSRFAKEGNNLFGQWCFFAGCGIVPSNRDTSATHEVATFLNTDEAVEKYIHNLNTNSAYKPFRSIRNENGYNGGGSGYNLASGLSKYSGLGDEYIGILRTFMLKNELNKFDNEIDP